jgi:hypothetical protein
VEQRLAIGLNVALIALIEGEPHVLCVRRPEGFGLPFGRFDPEAHRTFELALRDFVERQAAVPLGYVEQLYTFGDRGREAPRASLVLGDEADRIVSVGYLALAPEALPLALEAASWKPWYDFFPWEDRRPGAPGETLTSLTAELRAWAQGDRSRLSRIVLAFGKSDGGWEEERALDRYELMYEARLVAEAARDRGGSVAGEGFGERMISDHRRILATAIGRLRGKMRYRAVILRLMKDRFTLRELQRASEAILGFEVHQHNFRRSVEQSGLVSKTNSTVQGTGGRPAAVYRSSGEKTVEAATGLSLPRLRPHSDG